MLKSDRELTYAQALYEALESEMNLDERVFVYGLGVDDVKGMYGTTKDLHLKFSPDRCFDTPISEDSMTGLGIGAALAGFRPVHVHQRMDFLLLCMNQLINMAAKMHYVYDKEYSVPLVVRAIIGRSWGQGAQHSQSFHSFFMHTPGIKVIAPTTPYDAKGALVAAIRDNNPVIFLEHRMLYSNLGYVPSKQYEIEFGKARILRTGSDVTIIAISHMVVEALRAADELESIGISAEVIDPISLSPFDLDTFLYSVRKTKRLVVVDHSWLTAGASSEIITQILEKLDERIVFRRIGYAESPCPTTRPLEDIYYPSGNSIASATYQLVKGKKTGWTPNVPTGNEILQFKGPF